MVSERLGGSVAPDPERAGRFAPGPLSQHGGDGAPDRLGSRDALPPAPTVETAELFFGELDDGSHDDGIISRHHWCSRGPYGVLAQVLRSSSALALVASCRSLLLRGGLSSGGMMPKVMLVGL